MAKSCIRNSTIFFFKCLSRFIGKYLSYTVEEAVPTRRTGYRSESPWTTPCHCDPFAGSRDGHCLHQSLFGASKPGEYPTLYSFASMNFEKYLQHRSLSPSSRHTYLRQVHRYLSWWERDPQEAAYGDLLAYIQHLQNLGQHPGYINQQLGAIEKYYSYLKEEGSTASNPAQGLRIQGVGRTLPHALLDPNQLDQLYACYPIKTLP